MSAKSDSARIPIADSPWFWLELFCIVAVMAIALIGPKFQQRQGQIERRFDGRQHAYSRPAGEATAEPGVASRQIVDDNRVSLMPLQLVIAGVMLLAAYMLARSRTQAKSPEPLAERSDV